MRITLFSTGCGISTLPHWMSGAEEQQYYVIYSTFKNEVVHLQPVSCLSGTVIVLISQATYRMWRLGCVFQLRPYPLIVVEYDILAKERRKVPYL